MAKKKTEPKPMPTVEATTKPVRLDLPADVHKLLRVLSATADASMASYARDVVEAHVRREAKAKGIK
jgi:plasmid stability protein